MSRGAAETWTRRIDGTNGTGYNVYISMGTTAENVATRCKVARESQDEWRRSRSSALSSTTAASIAIVAVVPEPPATPAATSSPRTRHTR